MNNTFKLTINCDNEAFAGSALQFELARILRKVSEHVESSYGLAYSRVILDGNGNSVGRYSLGEKS